MKYVGGIFDIIPGYSDAVHTEQQNRLISYLPVTEKIGVMDALPLTPYHFLLLEVADNAFVVGGYITAGDIAQFLWVVSPEFQTGNSFWTVLKRKRHSNKVAELSFEDIVDNIKKYIDDSFQDSPGSSGSQSLPFSSWFSFIFDTLATEYSMTMKEALNLPLKCIFQQIKVIAKRNDPKATFFNPSDKVRTDYLKQLNNIE